MEFLLMQFLLTEFLPIEVLLTEALPTEFRDMDSFDLEGLKLCVEEAAPWDAFVVEGLLSYEIVFVLTEVLSLG